MIVIENVAGPAQLARRRAISRPSARRSPARGYRFGALEIDAAAFLPQSRPRAFVIAARDRATRSRPRRRARPRPARCARAQARLPAALQARWIWWRLDRAAAPQPRPRRPARAGRRRRLALGRRRPRALLAQMDDRASRAAGRGATRRRAASSASIGAPDGCAGQGAAGGGCASTAWPAACARPAAARRGSSCWSPRAAQVRSRWLTAARRRAADGPAGELPAAAPAPTAALHSAATAWRCRWCAHLADADPRAAARPARPPWPRLNRRRRFLGGQGSRAGA